MFDVAIKHESLVSEQTRIMVACRNTDTIYIGGGPVYTVTRASCLHQ